MLLQQTIDSLYEMKLTGMAQALEEQQGLELTGIAALVQLI